MVRTPKLPRTRKEIQHLGVDYSVYKSVMMESEGYDVPYDDEISHAEEDGKIIMSVYAPGSPNVKIEQSISGRTLDILIEGASLEGGKGIFITTPLHPDVDDSGKEFEIKKLEDAIIVVMPKKS
jgi:hypothetical protein